MESSPPVVPDRGFVFCPGEGVETSTQTTMSNHFVVVKATWLGQHDWDQATDHEVMGVFSTLSDAMDYVEAELIPVEHLRDTSYGFDEWEGSRLVRRFDYLEAALYLKGKA